MLRNADREIANNYWSQMLELINPYNPVVEHSITYC